MIQFTINFKNKLYSSDISIPRAEKIKPYIFTIAGIAFLIGILTTISSLIWKPNLQKNKTIDKDLTLQKESPYDASFPSIINRNIFNLKGLLPDKESNEIMQCSSDPLKSELPYKISGIIFGGTSENSLVMLDGGMKNIFKQGDLLPQGGILNSIEKNRILIVINNNCPEYIDLIYPSLQNSRNSRNSRNSSTSSKSDNFYKEEGFERDGNNTTASKQWVNNILTNNFSKTLEEAKATPNVVGGQIKGFVITNITQGSVYSKIGLKDGDVVSSINGIELNDAARAIQTLNAMRSESTIELQIIRGGQPLTFKVNIQ